MPESPPNTKGQKNDLPPIVTLPDNRLRTASRKISFIDNSVRNLIGQMIAVAQNWEAGRPSEIAVGLAAIQIGSDRRIIIVRNSFETGSPSQFSAFINPKIVKFFQTSSYHHEGCLSVPDCYARIRRFDRIKLEATDLFNRQLRLTASGFLARVLQHEIDHLKGDLIVDRVDNPGQDFAGLQPDGQLKPMTLAAVKDRGFL